MAISMQSQNYAFAFLQLLQLGCSGARMTAEENVPYMMCVAARHGWTTPGGINFNNRWVSN